MSIGIDSIDAQHKKLINMINALSDALDAGRTNNVLASILDDLAEYTVEYFAYEERLFAQYAYADEQASLVQHVRELQKKIDKGDFMLSIKLMSFLKGWLSHRILKVDMAYAQFLIEKCVK